MKRVGRREVGELLMDSDDGVHRLKTDDGKYTGEGAIPRIAPTPGERGKGRRQGRRREPKKEHVLVDSSIVSDKVVDLEKTILKTLLIIERLWRTNRFKVDQA